MVIGVCVFAPTRNAAIWALVAPRDTSMRALAPVVLVISSAPVSLPSSCPIAIATTPPSPAVTTGVTVMPAGEAGTS